MKPAIFPSERLLAIGDLDRAIVNLSTHINAATYELLLDFALKTTAAGVEERCRELRCGTVDSVIEANRAYASRYLSMRRQPERGTMTITVEVPLEAGELIDKAVCANR